MSSRGFAGHADLARAICMSLMVSAVAALGGLPSHAGAQSRGFALDRFDPAARGSDWFGLDSLDLRGHLRASAGATLDWGYEPLVLYGTDGSEVTALVKDQLFLHLGAGIDLWDRFRAGASIPIALFQDGSAGGTLLPTPSQGVTLGDVRLDLDARIFGAYKSPMTLAAGLQVFTPTGSRAAYTGDGKVRLAPRIMAAGKLARFEYAARLGVGVRFLDTQFAGTPVGSELQAALAAGVRLLHDSLIVGPELSFATGITRESAFFGRRTTGVELLAGAHYELTRSFRVGLAAGPGLSRGLGTPDLRVLASLDFAPPPGPSRAFESGELASIDVSAKRIRIVEQITFEFDSAKILPESAPVLAAVANLLRSDPAIRIRIEGHTDERGGPAYNKELSERRAESVLRWLVDHGISAKRLTSVGRGQEKPIASNATEEGRQRNRRVEFVIVE